MKSTDVQGDAHGLYGYRTEQSRHLQVSRIDMGDFLILEYIKIAVMPDTPSVK
jgi:hypothetical protein